MSDFGPTVPVSLQDAVRLFQDLEECVVSFDRIISRIGSGADCSILVEYLADRDLLSRLAWAREMMGDALEPVIGVGKVEDIAEDAYRYSDEG